MITSGLVVDGVVGGGGGGGLPAHHIPYNHQAVAVHNHHRMSYAEPSAYLKSVVPQPPQPAEPQPPVAVATPEFLRPLPKPAPVNPLKAPRASSKYAATADCRPVNLTATKDQPPPPPPPPEHHLRLDDRHHPYPVYGHPRLYVNASPFHHHHPYPPPMHQPAPYGVYTSPYTPVIPPRGDGRHHLMQPPQERRYPSPPTNNNNNNVNVNNNNKNGGGGCALAAIGGHHTTSPSSSPPEQFKVPNGRDNKPSPLQQQQQQQQRILAPPPPAPVAQVAAAAEPSPKKQRRNNTPEPVSPPAKKSNFTKGSLIRLANGNIKKVEDMRTEDFLNSVENSDLHKIDPSTVVRIDPVVDTIAAKGNIKITLSYGDQRNHQVGGGDVNKKTSSAVQQQQQQQQQQCKSHLVEMESGAEHPYFVFGRGWASWSPAKTLAKYGLTCQRLQVGDVCVSLTKRTAAANEASTAAAAAPVKQHRRQQQQQQQAAAVLHSQQHNNGNPHHHLHHHHQQQQLHLLHHPPAHHPAAAAVQKAQQQQHQQLLSDDDKNCRNKRRWSAPDPEAAT